jgi:hypothetical protein
MKRIFRDNPLIVASIALPLLVIILFAAATIIPRLTTPPPQHDLLLVEKHGNPAAGLPMQVTVAVKEGRVVMVFNDKQEWQTIALPRVYLYNPRSASAIEVELPEPDNWDEISNGDYLPVPALEARRVVTTNLAPDGYEYRGYRHGGGLMLDLFGGGRSKAVSISKDGAIYRVELPTDAPYWGPRAEFLGWIVEQER